MIHNPCKRNPQFNTVWMETRKVGYTLKEDLAPFVPLDFKLKPRMPLTEPSRNCWVHRHTCKWQYRNQGWSQRAIAKQFGLTRQGVAYLLQSRGASELAGSPE